MYFIQVDIPYALCEIDDEYLRNEHIYRNRDASAELVDWIDDNGGLAAFLDVKKKRLKNTATITKTLETNLRKKRTTLSKSRSNNWKCWNLRNWLLLKIKLHKRLTLAKLALLKCCKETV